MAGLGRVLLVNDAPRKVSRLAQWLQAKGYAHAVANNRREALEWLRGGQFDLVVFAHEFRPSDPLPPVTGAGQKIPASTP